MNNVLQMTTIVNKYLKLSNVKVSENTVSETIQNHPKPDSLACIKDVFNEMGVENLWGRLRLAHMCFRIM